MTANHHKQGSPGKDCKEASDTQEMSDSAGGGEGGGVAGAGQDTEADNEPPQQAPPLPEDDNLEEEAPPSAKRPRIIEEDQELEQPVKMQGETPAQTDLLEKHDAPEAQSRVTTAACVKLDLNWIETGRLESRG